jgi:hypothetical protein
MCAGPSPSSARMRMCPALSGGHTLNLTDCETVTEALSKIARSIRWLARLYMSPVPKELAMPMCGAPPAVAWL